MLQNFTQKYTIVQLLEDIPEGTQFSASDWPLHITVVDTFAIDWDLQTMIKNLVTLLANRPQAAAVAEDDAFFGPNKQTCVTLLQKSESLIDVIKKFITLARPPLHQIPPSIQYQTCP